MNFEGKKRVLSVAEKLDSAFPSIYPAQFLEAWKDYPEGQLLKELRTQLDYPQKDIAKEIGISAPALSNHEKRETVNHETAAKYQKILGIDAWDYDVLRYALSALPGYNLKKLLENPEQAINKLKEEQEEQAKNSKAVLIEGISGMLKELPQPAAMKAHEYVSMLYELENRK